MLAVRIKQINAVLKLQVVITMSVALVAAVVGGKNAAISTFLGGMVSVVASLTYGILISRFGKGSAESALVSMMRAESAKLLVIALLLWLVFMVYEEVNGVGFIGAFVVTTLVFSLAVFIRDK